MREGPRTPSKATDAILDCALVENTLISFDQKTSKAWLHLPQIPPPAAEELNEIDYSGLSGLRGEGEKDETGFFTEDR